MSRTAIYISRCENNPSGHGGDKRVAQICEILKAFDYDFMSTCNAPVTVSKWLNKILFSPAGYFEKIISKLYKQHVTYSKYCMWSDSLKDYIFNLHLLCKLFLENLRYDPKIIFIDDPILLAPVVYYAKSKRIPIVSFTQNLETLSREQVKFTYQKEMFTYELELLSMCDLIVTISTEETWLLRNFGMDPVYLPYFPVRQVAVRCEEVRSRRQGCAKSNFLLLGTVYNLPTLEGTRQVIAAITGSNILPADKLIIAGYGTKQLLDYSNEPRVEVRGEVTDAELDELLTETKAAIVYQNNGSGALTKIPELLTAGVPVIINSHAARSHHNLPGIFEFETFSQLHYQMEAASNSDNFPQILSSPATSELERRIHKLVSV